jgi:XTP/dITP diphosphohydrolase
MQQLLIATHNIGKLREYRSLLADLTLDIVNLDEAGIRFDVEETGSTFAENAILKARTYAEASGLWTWADDSGLEVDALGGRPGIYSARYAGPSASDEDRYHKLIAELQQQPGESWTARFRCVVALATPDGRIETIGDTVEGVIIDTPRGEHGFGYDPVFFMPERDATMAELADKVKNQISHRGKAALAAKEVLSQMIG